MFKAALFDLDGTLVDSEPQYDIFWGNFGRQYMPEIPNFAYQIKGTTLTSIFERFFPDDVRMQRITTKEIDDFEAQMDFPYVGGALEFIRDLKANGVKCAVVTSSNQQKMKNVWRKNPELLELMNIVLTSEDFSASKPDPDCYLKAAAALEEPLDNCIVFEDAISGLQAGMASGIYTIGLATGNPVEKIKPLCNRVIKDYKEVSYSQLSALSFKL